MSHLLLLSRLAEDEERQLRAAIERVIRIFKSRLFQVLYHGTIFQVKKLNLPCDQQYNRPSANIVESFDEDEDEDESWW